MKSKGILCFANNNSAIDYIKQAVYLAKRVKKYLDLPVSLVTSTFDKLDPMYHDCFDKIIRIQDDEKNSKRYYDGSQHLQLSFKNNGRLDSYDITPYDQTLILDTDFIICNDKFKNAFNSKLPFQIYKKGTDLCHDRNLQEFNYINDTGIDFYWATCVYFEKTSENKIFFNLLKHLRKNWQHYSEVYNLADRNFRNDHLFSIGIHMMNGFTNSDWAKPLPGKMYYTLDRDLLLVANKEKLQFMIQKSKVNNEFTLASVENCNVHVMNKFSLMRNIDV